MSAFNPFRRNLDGGTATATASTAQSTNKMASSLTSSPAQPIPSVPAFPRKSSLSLEIEEEDSTSSDEQTTDPFNPDSSVSDTEDDDKIQSSKSPAPGDRPRQSFGSAPHRAPSTDGSAKPPSEGPLATNEYNERSTASSTTSNTDQDIPSSLNRSTGVSGYKQSTSPTTRASRDKKPPPPPKSHHGKRIGVTANVASSQSASSRSNYPSSFHSTSPERLTTSRTAVNPNASSALPPVPDYFTIQSQSQAAARSNDSLSRSGSQNKRAPTPPLSRRQSQMRSKSTESKSSTGRLTMSSRDSESNDSSQPPSPGPSILSASSFSKDRNRMSMPPPSSVSPGDLRGAISSAGAGHLSPSTNSQSSQPGRRASSYGNIASGSSVAPPPPPPPRRAREGARNTGSRPVSQIITTEEPLPQPSNALDILADLSRLQKEVDDLRGQYESRKASE
ncbi:hypothetical protein N7486_000855 [Penicillium sp. IBT 16267x]|nr:hypothetical protein N7486_000855 [Penicillium sp. IBT 16267x]